MNEKRVDQIVKNHCKFRDFCKLVYKNMETEDTFRVWYDKNINELKTQYNKYFDNSKDIVKEEINSIAKKAKRKRFFKRFLAFSFIIALGFLFYYTL